MAIALVASAGKSGDDEGTAVTSNIDTTGATLLVAVTAQYSGAPTPATMSDSKGNTWAALTVRGAGDPNCRMYYVKNPTVGSGHNFTYSNGVAGGAYPALAVLAFSGSDTSADADVENGAGGSSPLATGSITPSTNNQVVVSGIGGHQTSMSVNSSMTKVIDLPQSVGYAISIAYIIQTSASAINPTWTASGTGSGLSAAIASFKSAGGSSVVPVPYSLQPILGQ